MKVPKGKYFSRYLFDSDGNSERIAAFKGATINWYDKLDNEKFYRIIKVSVRQNILNNVPELQIILGSEIKITEEIAEKSPSEIIPFPALGVSQKLSKGLSCRYHGKNSKI